MSKSKREKIKLQSTSKTGHFYTTTKSKKFNFKKISFIKFDPKLRKHIKYNEIKIK